MGDPYKMYNINVVQSCWNFAQLSKIKNKQVAKIWGLYLKKQRFGDTMQFPEGLLHVQEYFPNLLETALCH